MKLYLSELKELLDKIQKYKVKRVKITDKNFELLINTLQMQKINIQQTNSFLAKNQDKVNFTKQQASIALNKKETKNYVTIVSPMVGTFYRASSPNESPFVKVLDEVKFTQTVCIIEAMKLMNEIEAEVNGKIIDILVEDGEFVDCGQKLMIVEPFLRQ